MQDLIEKLPPIQRRHLNRQVMKRAWDYIHMSSIGTPDFYSRLQGMISRDEEPENVYRYCKLILKYMNVL